MIRLFENWYQLNDNGQWNRPVKGSYNARAFGLLCLGNTKARLMDDVICICNCASGYKLKLSDHSNELQNDIIDVLTPYLIVL